MNKIHKFLANSVLIRLINFLYFLSLLHTLSKFVQNNVKVSKFSTNTLTSVIINLHPQLHLNAINKYTCRSISIYVRV